MAKLQITALDGEHQGEVLEAQFNPKESDVDRTIPWVAPLGLGPLAFLGAQPARMSFELLFDSVEHPSRCSHKSIGSTYTAAWTGPFIIRRR